MCDEVAVMSSPRSYIRPDGVEMVEVSPNVFIARVAIPLANEIAAKLAAAAKEGKKYVQVHPRKKNAVLRRARLRTTVSLSERQRDDDPV